jgi:ceramide glucosyltransferase
MNYLALAIGALMLAERVGKQWLVVRFMRRPVPPLQQPPRLVSILQPVISGDPLLPEVLAATLAAPCRWPREILWLGDEGDAACRRICDDLMARFPNEPIRYLALPAPPQGQNPKMFKLARALAAAHGDIICVLDDDTAIPAGGLECCLPYLDQPGVGLAFGLPYYVSFTNLWSSMTAMFVDSNSLLTYIPYTYLTEPFTINGMFYAMRRAVLDQVGGFAGLEPFLADDFAIAHRMRQHGLRLAQTPLLHPIRTQVRDGAHYLRLLRRWCIAPRESIMRYITPRETIIFYALGLLPALFPLIALAALVVLPSAWTLGFALLSFGLNFGIFAWNNARYLRHAAPWRAAWLLPVMQLLFPLQAIAALLAPQRVNWRGNVMQIQRGGTFRYVQRRSG